MQKYPDLHWVGWRLMTPLAICQQWNEQRERQVPATVIKHMYASLQEFPPLLSEGFIAIYSVSLYQGMMRRKQSANIT